MRQLGIALIGLAFAVSTLLGAPTGAEAKGKNKGVGIDKVLGACKRTAGCSYTPDGPGFGTGCSPKVCFICVNSKCTADLKGNTKGTVLGGVRLPVGIAKSASGGTASGGNAKPVKRPVNAGLSNPPNRIKTTVTSGKGGGMGQGGGHHH